MFIYLYLLHYDIYELFNRLSRLYSFYFVLECLLFNLNFHPLEAVSRWRDSQLQVSENYLDLTK